MYRFENLSHLDAAACLLVTLHAAFVSRYFISCEMFSITVQKMRKIYKNNFAGIKFAFF